MAKQSGPIKITGTIGDLTFYQLNGVYYVKATSRVSKRRLKNDASFAGFRRAQERFKRASLLVKSVYKTIDKEKRFNGLYGKLVAQALPLVKQEMPAEEIIAIIMEPFRKKDVLVNEGVSSVAKKDCKKPVASVGKPLASLYQSFSGDMSVGVGPEPGFLPVPAMENSFVSAKRVYSG